MIRRPAPVLSELATRYEASRAGSTGADVPCRWIALDELLRRAGCASGAAYELALADLRTARAAGAIEVDERRGEWRRVRVSRSCEDALYGLLGRGTPTARREEWARFFREAAEWEIPATYRGAWTTFCEARARSVAQGTGFDPFSRQKLRQARIQLDLAARLLGWTRPGLLRSVSAELCRDSKRLGLWRGTLEKLLHATSGGTVATFGDLGIEDNPSTVRVHGPLRFTDGTATMDYGQHSGEFSIAISDLLRSVALETTAPRCVTVENPTTFHELARLGSGDLLVCTSYPNEATVRFLKLLPVGIGLFHFGDSDPWGFDVLLSLRRKTSRHIEPLHMRFRDLPGASALDARDRRKLAELISEPLLADVRPELEKMRTAGTKGDFEQERLRIDGPRFPYRNEV